MSVALAFNVGASLYLTNTNPLIGYLYFQQTLSPSNDYFRTMALP
jgi:hypothetical protein